MPNCIVPKLSKEKKANRKKHSSVSLCKSGLKHAQSSSLLRPLVHFLIQSRKSGYSECVALIQCLPQMQTQACMFTNSTWAAKSFPLEMIRQFQDYRCRDDSWMGFPSGYEIMFSFPRKYVSTTLIISCCHGTRAQRGKSECPFIFSNRTFIAWHIMLWNCVMLCQFISEENLGKMKLIIFFLCWFSKWSKRRGESSFIVIKY